MEFTKDWKACNRQKRFGSSNLPHSALFLKHANAHPRASVFFLFERKWNRDIYMFIPGMVRGRLLLPLGWRSVRCALARMWRLGSL